MLKGPHQLGSGFLNIWNEGLKLVPKSDLGWSLLQSSVINGTIGTNSRRSKMFKKPGSVHDLEVGYNLSEIITQNTFFGLKSAPGFMVNISSCPGSFFLNILDRLGFVAKSYLSPVLCSNFHPKSDLGPSFKPASKMLQSQTPIDTYYCTPSKLKCVQGIIDLRYKFDTLLTLILC